MQKICVSVIITIYVLLLIMSAYFCVIVLMYPKKFDQSINNVCEKFEISKPLFYALVNTESSFDVNAKSSAGAVGLTQILPSTAQYICVKNNINFSNFDLYNPDDNLYLGAMYLRYLFNRFNSTYTALAAYNAGETVVSSWLKNENYSYDQIDLYNIPYKETNNYINKIKNGEKIYRNFYKLI